MLSSPSSPQSFFSESSVHPRAALTGPPAVCQRTSVEMNPLKLGRGSSRGRQPASNGIKCPECLAWQGVQRAQRGLFRRAAAGKYWHFSGCRKSLWTFLTACGRPSPGRPHFTATKTASSPGWSAPGPPAGGGPAPPAPGPCPGCTGGAAGPSPPRPRCSPG